jgi:hypothetical protein
MDSKNIRFAKNLIFYRKKTGRRRGGKNVPRRGGEEERTNTGVNMQFCLKIVLI